jgi:hypothetical protein
MTIQELQKQRRWVLWRLESGKDDKPTKVPYQPNGCKASITNPKHLHSYAELEPLLPKFSGIGLALGEFDGVAVWGVDFDKCCDAVTGKFSPETRQVVIDLDSYAEYSPSGTGAHVLGLGKIPLEPGKKAEGIIRPHPGCKQVEVKGRGYFFTYSGRHLNKTPATLEDRQAQILALYHRVSNLPKSEKTNSLTITVPFTEEEKLERLWAGDMSAYNNDHSTADFALCILLAKKYNCNAFKIDAEFRKSALYREKWEDRADYRENTITRAVAAVMKDSALLFTSEDAETFEDDGETEFLVESLDGPDRDGWFPKGELSLIGAPSGAGKTSWAMPVLEKIRLGEEVWGHGVSKPRDYRVLLHDRSKKAMRRTARALHMSSEAMERIIRLTPDQQKRQPAEILEAAIATSPGVQVWFIEGLDLWIPDMNKMNVVAPVVDSLQRIATRRNVAVIATVGAPKQRGKDRYYGRDALFGSSALARKVETVILMSLHNEEDPNSVRRCWILPRAGKAEVMYFRWESGGLALTKEPDAEPEDNAFARMTSAVHAAFKPDEPIMWKDSLGSEASFYRWKKEAIKKRLVVQSGGRIYLSASGTKWGPADRDSSDHDQAKSRLEVRN